MSRSRAATLAPLPALLGTRRRRRRRRRDRLPPRAARARLHRRRPRPRRRPRGGPRPLRRSRRGGALAARPRHAASCAAPSASRRSAICCRTSATRCGACARRPRSRSRSCWCSRCGIGATTAIFGVIDAALLRALPYPEPERLVAVRDLQGEDEVPASFPEYQDWKGQTDVFAETGAYFTTTSRSPATASRRCCARCGCRRTCRGCSASCRASDARSRRARTMRAPSAW